MKVLLAATFLLIAVVVDAQAAESTVADTEKASTPGILLLQTRFDAPQVPPPDFRRWRATIDGVGIREHEIYQMAGYEEEFLISRKHYRTTLTLLIASPAVFGISFVTTIASVLYGNNPIIGPVLMLGSAVTFVIGLIRLDVRWSTWSDISPIVNDYNQMLMEGVRNGP